MSENALVNSFCSKTNRTFSLLVVPYLNVIRNPEPEKFLLVALESEILLKIEIRNSSSTDKSYGAI